MRHFILLSLKGTTTSEFSLSDLPHAGRLDLVCRTVSNALWVSHHIRPDTTISVVLNGPPASPKTITFSGDTLTNVQPDERSLARLIQTALDKGASLSLHQQCDVCPGVTITKQAVESLLQSLAPTYPVYYLDERGRDFRTTPLSSEGVFLLGDMIGLPDKTKKLLKRFKATPLTLGPIELFASHCPILIHNELDRHNAHW